MRKCIRSGRSSRTCADRGEKDRFSVLRSECGELQMEYDRNTYMIDVVLDEELPVEEANMPTQEACLPVSSEKCLRRAEPEQALFQLRRNGEIAGKLLRRTENVKEQMAYFSVG